MARNEADMDRKDDGRRTSAPDLLELCACPECGMPAEVVRGEGNRIGRDELVGVRCVARHWFFGLRDRLVA